MCISTLWSGLGKLYPGYITPHLMPSKKSEEQDQPTATLVDFIELGQLRATSGGFLVFPYVEMGISRGNK